jgi:hypothetical protein
LNAEQNIVFTVLLRLRKCAYSSRAGSSPQDGLPAEKALAAGAARVDWGRHGRQLITADDIAPVPA